MITRWEIRAVRESLELNRAPRTTLLAFLAVMGKWWTQPHGMRQESKGPFDFALDVLIPDGPLEGRE